MASRHRVAVLATDGAYPFELGIPHRVFGAAGDHYQVKVCSADGRPVRTNAGFSIIVEHGPEALRAADTVVIPPFFSSQLTPEVPQSVVEALTNIASGTRLVSICTGSFVLAAAGRLDGRPATTHWALAEQFRSWYPRVLLNPDVLFIDDDDVLTSAGAASGIDVCLHIVRKDHGSDVANRAARMCVVPPWRDGGQAQYIQYPVPQGAADGTARVQRWALENLHQRLTLPDLAAQANMSLRTFARHFNDEVGMSPGRWLMQQRINMARHLLESTDLPVDDIAYRAGFSGGTSLREHMRAALGVTPSSYRRTFRNRP